LPLWDEDGKTYLNNLMPESRWHQKYLVIKQLNEMALGDRWRKIISMAQIDRQLRGLSFISVMVIYILAPAGGVSTGWQLALRFKKYLGPYERKVVMDQGSLKSTARTGGMGKHSFR